MTTAPTMQDILRDDNLLSSLTIKEGPEYKIDLLLVYTGGPKVQYYMFFNNEIIFSGNDFRPSPLYNIDDLESAVSLLAFLTLQKGDTDDKYFENYTPEQINFSAKFETEQLKGMVSDFDFTNSEYHKRAKKYFNKAFNKL